jgi:hypothetical protein
MELALQVSFGLGAAVLHSGTAPGAAGVPREKADSSRSAVLARGGQDLACWCVQFDVPDGHVLLEVAH